MNQLQHFFQKTARPDRAVAVGDRAAPRSYASMYRTAEQLASHLQTLGLRDRFLVVIWMEATPHYLEALMAVVVAGGIPIPMHSGARGSEVCALVERLHVDLIFVQQGYELHQTVLTYESEADEDVRFDFVVTDPAAHEDASTAPEVHPETAMIFTSSGSTGVPKCIMLSRENIIANLRSIQASVSLQEHDRVLISKSLGYASTLIGEWMLALQAGADLVLTSGLIHPLQLIKCIKQSEATFLCTVPATTVQLLKSKKWTRDDLVTLQHFVIVGGAMPAPLLLELQERLAGVQIRTGYGLTEAAPRVTHLPPEQVRARPSSAGLPVRDVTVHIVDPQGNPVAAGVIGEIVVEGPNVMLGYVGDAERTAAVMLGNKLRTFDIGYLDADGYLYVTGRADSAMNVGGQTLYPEPIEQVFQTHPQVAEVGVVGVPDDVWGERVIACIVPTAPPLDRQGMLEFAQERLTSVHRPRMIYETDQLPKTKSGKLDRATLREMVKGW